MVLISIFLIIYKLVVLRKVDDDSFTQHFLSFPYITLSFFILLFFFNHKLFLKWFYKIIPYDEKYYSFRFKKNEEIEFFLKLFKIM